ncbi:TerC family protein [Ornithinibacillus scapharcae]|uniref:TerC family protein n=1 Tax=Ornithinibacillus scapharcae TaxID=1147159 RepID=UPI000225AAE6|nr:TerC family protein [Ornithinibacillus scapharcae]
MDIFAAETILTLLTVVAIDLVLSGDNAVVIAMATRRLPEHNRNKAIYLGTGFAIVLRIVFAVVIALLLNIPLVHFFGGLLLLYIAYHVLVNNGQEENSVEAKDSIAGAVGTIIAADAVMSLDNVVAVAGASKGNILILALGVLISIPIMIFGSKIIVKFMEKYPWIAYIGSGILAWTAGNMIIGDEKIMEWFHIKEGIITYIFSIIVTVLLLAVAYFRNQKRASSAN